MFAVGGDFFGVGKIVAVRQLGVQNVGGRQLGGRVHPNFMRLRNGGGAQQHGKEGFFMFLFLNF